MALIFSVCNKNYAPRCVLLSTLLRCSLLLTTVPMTGLLTACQPPAPTATSTTAEDPPIIISAGSVTMAPEYILDVKPSRYQPSLGLQGDLEPIKQARLTAAQDLQIKQILVTKGQWVEKGSPLLIVQRQTVKNAVTDITTKEATARKNGINNQAAKNTTNQQSKISTNSVLIEQAVATPASNKADTTISTNDQLTKELSEVATTEEVQADDSAVVAANSDQLITIRASISGKVNDLYIETVQQLNTGDKLLHLEDDSDLRFIATLPIQAEPQLSVGQTVNFTTEGLTEKFTGQVSKLLADSQSAQLLVYVHVIKNEASRGILQPKMAVTGRVNYGQIKVGTIVPKRSIHDVDLTELQNPPYRPLSQLMANVWIIKQNQRLTRQPVEVIEYNPSTGQYLIAGITNDSLICLADLPLESAGKKVIVS